MIKHFVLGHLLLQSLVVVAMESADSSQIRQTPSGKLLRCSQEAFQKSQEEKPRSSIENAVAYYVGFCGNFKGEYQERTKPLPPSHYCSDCP